MAFLATAALGRPWELVMCLQHSEVIHSVNENRAETHLGTGLLQALKVEPTTLAHIPCVISNSSYRVSFTAYESCKPTLAVGHLLST